MSNDKFLVKNLSDDDLKMVLGASSGASQALVHRQMEEVAGHSKRDPIARAEKMLPRQPLMTRPMVERDAEDGPKHVSVYVRGQEPLVLRTAKAAPAERAQPSQREAPATAAPVDKLERLVDMRLRGLITDDEFRAMKRRLSK
jgi:hypothetical protein